MTEINPEHLAARIAQFRDERRALQEMVVACFPIGSQVRERHTKEIGTVWSTVHGHCDMLHVQYSFGTQCEDVLDLERVNEPDTTKESGLHGGNE